MALIAKPIVKNQLWVITDGVKKIGNIESTGNSSGYSVKIGDNVNYFSSTKSIERDVELIFEQPSKSKQAVVVPFAHWPTDGRTYNNFYDVKRKIHVYTKTAKSKCYHAAGYFKVNLNGEWQTMFAPKFIFIQRYPYFGPFITAEQASVD